MNVCVLNPNEAQVWKGGRRAFGQNLLKCVYTHTTHTHTSKNLLALMFNCQLLRAHEISTLLYIVSYKKWTGTDRWWGDTTRSSASHRFDDRRSLRSQSMWFSTFIVFQLSSSSLHHQLLLWLGGTFCLNYVVDSAIAQCHFLNWSSSCPPDMSSAGGCPFNYFHLYDHHLITWNEDCFGACCVSFGGRSHMIVVTRFDRLQNDHLFLLVVFGLVGWCSGSVARQS